MDSGHCFISYSHADGLDFVTKLADELEGGHPFIQVWFEKREMVAGLDDWDDQLAKAIRDCKCLLYVMSKDSTAGHSNCKAEWTWALKYKKPVICLLIDKDAEDQFRLNSRQKIDFTSNFDQGLARLRKSIAHLDSPEGELEELRHRLADANRDLQRVTDEEKPRVQADIDELTKQIEIQQRIVDDPEAAKAQTQKNIETGLERERKPEKETKTKETTTKFINPPPGIAPIYFQDRYDETREILRFLNDDSQRMMTIVGRGGVGKTAMVCRLLKGLEGGELPDGLGSMKVEGIVYLSESGSHRVNFANLFYDLCKLLPADAANALDAVYKNPQASTASKMSALSDRFTAGKVVLLLDNVEPLISVETFDIADAELDECLRALLHGAHSALKVILTTRVAPRGLNLCEPGRQRVLTLDSGLEQKYAVEMLREMDVDGKLGLKSADAEALKRAYERTLGFPRALEALFAILASDRYTTLDELLTMPTPDNVVEALVGEAFNRLDTNAQKVMQALAVYNRPVTPAAVDYLLAPHLPAMDSAPILQRLANMHFARKESGRFYLHPVDREFVFSLLAIGDAIAIRPRNVFIPIEFLKIRTDFTQIGLTDRAADYFSQARKSRAEWKKLEDLSAQLAEFDLRYAAGDYDSAASVLTEIDGDYLLLWGHYRLTINMHSRLRGLIGDSHFRISHLNILGSALFHISHYKESIQVYEEGLSLTRQTNNRHTEGTLLGNLGSSYLCLGDYLNAIELLEHGLDIDREIGDRSGESARLINLGSAYAKLGNIHKAIELLEQASLIAREVSDYRIQGFALGHLGSQYIYLGDVRKASEVYEQALAIHRDISDRRGEFNALASLGNCWADLGDLRRSIDFYEHALIIAREIGDREGEETALNILAKALTQDGQYASAIAMAKQGLSIAVEIDIPAAHAYETLSTISLIKGQLDDALFNAQEGTKFDEPNINHNVSTLLGIIALRQGDEVAARGAFLRAIGQADEILSKTAEYYSALDAKGLALCGLALTASDSHLADDCHLQAIETFRKARKIAPHAGIVKATLRLFDELAKCEGGDILKEVRQAVEGKE
ncbi:MAG TPA: tetratricopeptide repeat protein [Anaerolineales bacterium]|nr:tetratricopeptide repeat protein [Anaerolineales bacterium]